MSEAAKLSMGGVFLMINSFHAEVDYSQAGNLGLVFDTDSKKHEGKVNHVYRFPSKGKKLTKVVFVHPREPSTTIGETLDHAKRFGFRPASLNETSAVIQATDRDHLTVLFRGIDIVNRNVFPANRAKWLALVCLGSYVNSPETGPLTPVLKMGRGDGRKTWLHLCQTQREQLISAAQMVPLVRA